MGQQDVAWTPNTRPRITDHEGRAVADPPTASPEPRVSRVELVAQVGNDQTLVTIHTVGLRGDRRWNRRQGMAVVPLKRADLERDGLAVFTSMLAYCLSVQLVP